MDSFDAQLTFQGHQKVGLLRHYLIDDSGQVFGVVALSPGELVGDVVDVREMKDTQGSAPRA